MKISDLGKRLRKDRPMTSVTLRIPVDVVDDLKRVAPMLGFSGYQPLMRAYIGQGLRQDLERLESPRDMQRLVSSLRRRGVDKKVLQSAVEELQENRTARFRRTRA